MGKRSVSALLLATLVAGFIAFIAPAANALTSVESCFYNKIQSERASAGRAKLTLMADLTSIARNHSQKMRNDGTIYHNNNLGNDVQGNWTAVGENVGMGPSCQSIHDAFMASAGHRANILDRDYNQVGVGVAVGGDGTIYVTEDFAGRKSSTTTHHTTTVRRTTRTVTHRAPVTHVASRPAPKPKPKPKPVAKPPAPVLTATPMTVSVLVKLVGMDARRVDPATGDAMGL